MSRTLVNFQDNSWRFAKVFFVLNEVHMKFKFTLEDGYDFDRDDVKGHAYLTNNEFKRMSAAVFTCNGKTKKMKSLNNDRLYIIVEGNGVFTIKNLSIDVHKNDIVIVPKNTIYNYCGVMKCFLVHSPAFNKGEEIIYRK
jgi:mannose-6-phosphate isomerase-like protein (cupin superfamily)